MIPAESQFAADIGVAIYDNVITGIASWVLFGEYPVWQCEKT